MKKINRSTSFNKKAIGSLAIVSLAIVACADVFAGGGVGTLGDAAKAGGDNIPAIVTLIRWIFAAVGLTLAGMGILAFFKKGQPPEVGKNIGMIIGGAILFALPWLISSSNTSLTGSDTSSDIQNSIIE